MNSSSSSSGVASNRGFPSKCDCGLDVMIWTSKTQENPGRPFYRCVSKRDVSLRSNKRDGHLFKWVEDAVFEEIEDGLPKLGSIESELSNAKSDAMELMISIEGLKEDIMWSKKEIRKWKAMSTLCVVFLCLMTIVIVYMLVGKYKETKFVVGY